MGRDGTPGSRSPCAVNRRTSAAHSPRTRVQSSPLACVRLEAEVKSVSLERDQRAAAALVVTIQGVRGLGPAMLRPPKMRGFYVSETETPVPEGRTTPKGG